MLRTQVPTKLAFMFDYLADRYTTSWVEADIRSVSQLLAVYSRVRSSDERSVEAQIGEPMYGGATTQHVNVPEGLNAVYGAVSELERTPYFLPNTYDVSGRALKTSGITLSMGSAYALNVIRRQKEEVLIPLLNKKFRAYLQRSKLTMAQILAENKGLLKHNFVAGLLYEPTTQAFYSVLDATEAVWRNNANAIRVRYNPDYSVVHAALADLEQNFDNSFRR